MPVEMTDEVLKELKATFDVFDEASEGRLPAARIGTLLRAVGETPTQARVEELVREAEERGGTITLDDFITLVSDVGKANKRLTRKEVEDAFAVFDQANKGWIHIDELRRTLTTFGEKLSEEEVDKMIMGFKKSEDGKIDYAELAKTLVP